MKTIHERGDTAVTGRTAAGAGNDKAAALRAQRRGDSRARLEQFLWIAARICRAYRREQ